MEARPGRGRGCRTKRHADAVGAHPARRKLVSYDASSAVRASLRTDRCSESLACRAPAPRTLPGGGRAPQNETLSAPRAATATTTRSATPWPRTGGMTLAAGSIIQMTSRRCPRRRRSACARRSSLRRCRPRRPSRRPSSGPAPRRRPAAGRRVTAVVARAARRGDLGATLRLVARAARRAAAPRGASPPRRRRRSRRSSRRCPGPFAPRPFFCLRRPRCPHLHVGPDVSRAVDALARSTQVRPRRPPARDAGCRDAAAALARRASPRPSPKKQPAAPRDLSVPFDAARDSRLHHRGREQAYALRERCRDRFLDLLRDYEAARRDANRERLFPPADDAFFFGKRRPQRRGARQTRDAFRDRASQVCRAVPPEHVGWFARVFTDILTAAAAAEDVYDEADDAFWAGSPLETVPGQLRIFALFVVGADAKAFSDSLREVLVATLSEDVDADALPRTRVGEALAKRTAGAALLGFLRSAPNFGSSSQRRAAAGGPRRRSRVAKRQRRVGRARLLRRGVGLRVPRRPAVRRRVAQGGHGDHGRARGVAGAPRLPRPVAALLAARLDVEACLRRLGRPLASRGSVPAPASPTSPASPRDAWSPRRAPNVADADALRSPAAARAARAWFSAAVSVVSPAKTKTPPKKVTPLLVKPAPAAREEKKAEAASPTATATAARRALLKPVAAAFFRRAARARRPARGRRGEGALRRGARASTPAARSTRARGRPWTCRAAGEPAAALPVKITPHDPARRRRARRSSRPALPRTASAEVFAFFCFSRARAMNLPKLPTGRIRPSRRHRPRTSRGRCTKRRARSARPSARASTSRRRPSHAPRGAAPRAPPVHDHAGGSAAASSSASSRPARRA